ncbi:MAG: glycosyltransferase, partial [Pseudomonadota bacterium]
MRIQGHRPTSLHLKARLEQTAVDQDIIRFGRFLENHGHRMVLATAGGDGVRLAEAWKLDHEVVSFARPGLLSGWRSRGRLSDLLDRWHPVVVQAHDGETLKAAVGSLPHEMVLIANLDTSPDVLNSLEPRLIEACRHILVPTHFDADELIEHDVVPAAKIRVVRPTVDMREFDPSGVSGSRITALAERWRIDVDRRVILMPAPIRPGHGHANLIEALARLERHDFHLVMLGDHAAGDSFAKDLENRAGQAGLGDCLRFMNDCDDMTAAYALAELVIFLPDSAHPLPRRALEAQAMGKPVILTAVGATHELTMPATTGWLVAKGDAAELD